MTDGIPLLLPFAAGLLSFLSPCVLPLIPSYLGILGSFGTGAGTDSKEGASRPGLLWAALSFVLGFSTVFIILGIIISTTFLLMGGIGRYINMAAGIIVISLGLNVCFDFISLLNFEKRPFLLKITGPENRRRPALAAAFITGAAFGAGWTPCIGPVLTGILLLAAQGGQTPRAVLYLALYSAGLALPFILGALFFKRFLVTAAWFRSHLVFIQRLCGVLLILMGLLILTGRYSALNTVIQNWTLSYIEWAGTRAFPFRILAGFFAWLQGF